MQIFPLIQKDFYKVGHFNMFPEGTTLTYNNLTARKSRIPNINHVVVFGIQYFIKEYLINQWNNNFFNKPKEEVLSKYKRITDNCLGKDSISIDHFNKLHDLGYLPIEIKALEEGTICPIGVPILTYRSTNPIGYFLPGMLETILSTTLWAPMTVATISNEYRRISTKYAKETSDNIDFVKFQNHDFAMRGMSSLETAMTCGAAHLLSFVGTDTIPSIEFLEEYYNCNIENELVGCSVKASEHSVMCSGTKEGELNTIKRLLEINSEGILSLVLDTWDLTKVCAPTKEGYLHQLKELINSRNGTLVVRPDSTPEGVSIAQLLFGKGEVDLSVRENEAFYPEFYNKGLLQCLYEIFGGEKNSKGFIELPSTIKVIYGDGLGLHNLESILQTCVKSKFCTSNIVFGVGSYGFQKISRDELGFAVKATYIEVNGESREIFKDPITDDGTKKSAKGLLQVNRLMSTGELVLYDQCSKEQEQGGLLQTVFKNGKLIRETSLKEIREKLNN